MKNKNGGLRLRNNGNLSRWVNKNIDSRDRVKTITDDVPISQPMLSEGQVGEMLGISPYMVRKLCAVGHFPAPVMFGSLLRWKRGEVERWIESKRTNPNAEARRTDEIHTVTALLE